jgi:hypothetical protein
MAPASGNLLGLPDELLLVIAEYLVVQPRYDRRGYKDITTFAITHPKLSKIAREVPQRTDIICVAIRRIHALVRTLINQPQWATKLRKLEITNYLSLLVSHQCDTIVPYDKIAMQKAWYSRTARSFKEARSFKDKSPDYQKIRERFGVPWRIFDVKFDRAFRTGCLQVISLSNIGDVEKQRWTEALRAGRAPAFLAILLSMLPNLKVLYCGAS